MSRFCEHTKGRNVEEGKTCGEKRHFGKLCQSKRSFLKSMQDLHIDTQ